VAVEHSDQRAREGVAHPRLGEQGARLAASEGAGSDDQVGAPLHGLEQSRHLFRVVGEIAVEKHDDVGRPERERRDARETCAAVPPTLLANDSYRNPDPQASCDFGGPVGRTVVDHDDLVDGRGRNGAEDQGKRVALVEDGNDDRHASSFREMVHGTGRADRCPRIMATASPARIRIAASAVLVVSFSPSRAIASTVVITGWMKT